MNIAPDLFKLYKIQ